MGQFDVQRKTPYSALSAALNGLCCWILERHDQLAKIRSRLVTAVGSSHHVLLPIVSAASESTYGTTLKARTRFSPFKKFGASSDLLSNSFSLSDSRMSMTGLGSPHARDGLSLASS